ncbi:alpha/beta hydrolase [Oceanihabitans sp. 2_MG-2023]|uniref:alpha/beta fold hydrolase n=1 Tax=Oceanihabitans sp. 2_MG-2023 TaxID=3062661 RepID=UPI0026E3DFFF|nr:alpha/beta hydrolase [Oceanihabitans sp. 2_MG-2023]MDO6596263.1 alpha/beta hydrolase [Oceanihabitans sp. 2_MG-2023]
MEETQITYKIFTRLAVALGTLNGLTIREAKKLVGLQFKQHPCQKEIKVLIKNVKKDEHEIIEHLLDEMILVCDELGPNRDYITLIKILENIGNSISKGHDQNEYKYTNSILDRFKKEITIINKKIPIPPLFNMMMESRSLIEWSSIYCLYPFIPKRIKGKGKPVLLIPPYLGDDFSTSFVRKYLKSLGFATYKWDLGFNMVKAHYIPRLEEKLADIYQQHQEKVSIVGWSGGGIFAKIMANRHPSQVEQILTIGSPIWGVMDMKTPVYGLLEFFRGKSLKERNERFLAELEPIPTVPVTCIYTKTDGLVPWKHCMEAETFRKNIKNIEVYGSHSGMGANASVLLTTANALSANLNGKEIQEVSANIERFLYPHFWNKARKALQTKKAILPVIK